MRGAVKNYVFGQKWEPNTIIGGIGGTINTKALLATKLGISESIIGNFEVVGSDVQCRITSNYQLPVSVFKNNTSITSYHDFDGRSISGGAECFSGSSILKATFPSWTSLPNDAFFGSQLNELNCGNLTILYANSLYNTKLVTLNEPQLVNLSTSSLRGTNLLATTNFNLVSINTYALYESIAKPSLSNVTTLGNSSLERSSYLRVEVPLITSITAQSVFRQMTLCEEFVFTELTSMSSSSLMWHNCTSAELISAKKLKTYGTLAAGGGNGNSYGFANLKTGCLIQVHEDLATANAGNPHEALVWVKANRSAIVEFYDDAGNHVSTL